ncbi:lactosylceramide 4-alpha-galactosyltransferase-like [Dermacentor albipictus]|uniref:lactosylceramide 4-alpha-galactosyltransferase-like n=1 Tax=Dermacentor albipictus TaxID=60249 RepID=UPI0031FD1861
MEGVPLLGVEPPSRPLAFVTRQAAREVSFRRRLLSSTNELRRFAARLTAAAVIVMATLYFTVASKSYEGNVKSARGTGNKSRMLFLETGHAFDVTGRFSCAIESAARHHPGWTVNVLAAVGTPNSTDVWLDGPFRQMLGRFPNVAFDSVQVADVIRGTPLGSWSLPDPLKDGPGVNEQLSNALRLALLYKRGGVYLDKDTVVMRPLHGFDACLSQTSLRKGDSVSNSFLFFEAGHSFVRDAMKRIASDHHPDVKSSLGPPLLHDALLERCGVASVAPLAEAGRRCRGVLVLPWHVLMPVAYTAWPSLFAAEGADANSSRWEACRHSHAMCLYGKLSARKKAEKDSPYWRAASEHCPRSLEISVDVAGRF